MYEFDVFIGCFTGSLDIYSMPEGKSNVDLSKEMPMYVNTRHINMETLHALQTEAENLFTEKIESTKDSRPGKDIFDMSTFILPSFKNLI